MCKRGPGHAFEAMECLGGNGYIEDFPLARRYREQPDLAIWEGSGNVIALDVLRAIAREPETVDAYLAEVSLADGEHPVFDAYLAGTRTMLAAAPDAAQARRLTERLALTLQASLMLRHSPAAAGAFVESRLGADRGMMYGTLPTGTDLKAILDRH